MTETEWLGSTDAHDLLHFLYPMYDHLDDPLITRDLRLYLVSLCRAIWDRLPAVCRAAVAFAEQLADDPRPDRATLTAVRQVFDRLLQAFDRPELLARCEQDLRAVGLDVPHGRPWVGDAEEWSLAIWLTSESSCHVYHHIESIRRDRHRPDLLRCIYGNPFRPVAFDPQWRTRTVIDLARTMYESRDFGAMPILADALEEAGCDDADVLAHCRGESPHARGCWVVDAVLGK